MRLFSPGFNGFAVCHYRKYSIITNIFDIYPIALIDTGIFKFEILNSGHNK
jgi:hypothetical protein